MPRVTYIEHSGAAHEVDVPVGESVMRGAYNHSLEGIVAECGGGLACATCHVFVDEAWTERVGPPSEPEQQMLDFAATPAQPNSRLSCQITMTEALDGLIVRMPKSQI